MQAASPNGLPVVYVGRPTRWGNYCIDVTPQKRVDAFRVYATRYAKYNPRWIEPLCGKNLACWCSLSKECHADVLLELANPERMQT